MSRRRKRSSVSPLFLILVLAAASYNRAKDLILDIDFKLIGAGMVAVLLALWITPLVFCKLKRKRERQKYINSGIAVVDRMKGVEFENFLLAHFEGLGYKGRVTQASNDYGADLLLTFNDEKIIVQAKRYSSKIGIKAIQEISAALPYFKADKGMVVTNNYFTKNAEQLAAVNNIELWDRDRLTKVMDKNTTKGLANQIVGDTAINKICPECGGSLLTKSGQYGSFHGCSQYPKCEFTRTL